MKLCPVSKKLRKYAYAHGFKDIERSLLLIYADEIKRLEERLVKSEVELAWKNSFDTEEHVKDLQVRLDATDSMLKAWQEVFHCDAPWEAEIKHKADIAVLSTKLEKMERMLIMMMPVAIRFDVLKAFNVKKTEY